MQSNKRKRIDAKLLKTVASEIFSDSQLTIIKDGQDVRSAGAEESMTPLEDDALPPLPGEDSPPPLPVEEPPPLPGSEMVEPPDTPFEDGPPPPPDEPPPLDGTLLEMPMGGLPTLDDEVEVGEQEEDGVEKPQFKKKMQLGEILVRHSVISQTQLEYALKYQQEKARDTKLGVLLIRLNLIPESKYGMLINAILAQLMEDKVNLEEVGQFIDLELYNRFKLSQLKKDQFFPLRIVERGGVRILDVFIKSDADLFKMDDLAAIFSVSKVRPVGEFDGDMLGVLLNEIKRGKATEIKPEAGDQVGAGGITILSDPDDEEVDEQAIKRGRDDNYISRMTNKIVFEGVNLGASDIHVEFGEVPRVRYRVDGLLQEGGWVTPEDYPAVISRLKIMSELDISERRVPQDGNIRLGIEGFGVLDFRVNTIPVGKGEKVCLRILDANKLHDLTLDMLGFPDDILESLIGMINRPQGMVLITGPTGSGKSTTLYSSLIYILEDRGKETNICTAEDPIEYRLDGLNQTQMNEKVGLTFPKILKALLRQDPDIILVGEIRDLETAELGIKASQTGHLVLSTLHTNTAVATIGRMVNMGVPPYLMADSLLAVLNQRLGRRICKKCAEPYKPSKKELAIIPLQQRDEYEFIKGRGCAACGHRGYKGRLGFYEYLRISRELKRLIIDKSSEEEMLLQAQQENFLTMRDFALGKVKDQLTTLEEVLVHTIDQFE